MARPAPVTARDPGTPRPWPAVAAVLAATLALAGCLGAGMQDLEDWVEEVKARRHHTIEPLPEIRVPEVFSYPVSGRPDPFRPVVDEGPAQVTSAPSSGIAPPANHVREELEQFPLDTLRMVGTLQRETQLWGLVTAPDGAVHRVQPGNYLGKSFGKITLVADDRIELVEIIPDGIGGWQERQAKLDLTE